jgi:hypothetical protein
MDKNKFSDQGKSNHSLNDDKAGFIPFKFQTASFSEKAIYFSFILIIFLHAGSIFFPPAFAWGINAIAFLNLRERIMFILFSILIFFPFGQKLMYYIIDLFISTAKNFRFSFVIRSAAV